MEREEIQSGRKEGKKFVGEDGAGALNRQKGSVEICKLKEPQEEDTVLESVGLPEVERTVSGVRAA